ncbi:MAG: MFS transporter [Chloroflexi bacterium]|nr:MFS transporter [Chloroflexota bacterium]MCL5275007.1 MFS transporter [Chloroflexota bacterium]
MQSYLDHLRSFTRDARLFLLALTVFAFAASAPGIFFNLYLQALGFDRTFIGVTATVSQLGGAIASIPAAYVLDVIGRRHSAIIGAILSIAAAVATLLTVNPAFILAIQALGGFGVVLYALAVVPLLAESSTPRERTTLFSTVEGLTTLALFFGSLIAGGLPALAAHVLRAGVESAEAYRAVMLGSLALRALGVIPLALIGDRAKPPDGAPAHPRTISYFNPRVLLKLETPIWKYVLPLLITYLGGSLIFPFLNLYLKQRFEVSDVLLGSVFGGINLAVGLFTLAGPFAARALGRARAVALGAFFSAACLILIGFGNVFAIAAAVVVLRAGLFNMTLPLYRALVIDHTPPHEYVVVNLIYSTAVNVGPTVAPSISGYVQDRAGFAPLFVAAAALYAVAGSLFHLATREVTRPKVVRRRK